MGLQCGGHDGAGAGDAAATRDRTQPASVSRKWQHIATMGLFAWFRRERGTATAARDWHDAWDAAVAALDADAVPRLEAPLRAQPPLADDVEVEEEMLQGLRDLLALERELAAARLPSVETAHRVAAGEPCHFSAPVSMPDDPAQPTGRLLLTSRRAAFAGGSRAPAIPWHAARDVVRNGRDLILLRAGGDDGYRFRCNSFSDALCGTAIARHLIRAARKPL